MSVIPPQINVPLTPSENMSIETYAMLKSITDALVAAQETITAQAATIADHEARITALEP